MQEDGSGTVSNIEMIFKRCEPYMQKARELFPYESWTDYWYANMYATLDDYAKAYPYIQTLLSNPSVCSMQIYPEVLELASRGAESLGRREEAAEYRALLAGLSNEFGIDISAFSLFMFSDALL
jgi:predicted Zn-dependent protease